jgi:hypothetical protein
MVRRIARSRAAALRASSPCRPAASIRRIARHSSWSSLLLREFVRSISIAAPAETFDNYAADNFFVSDWELHAKALLAYPPEFFSNDLLVDDDSAGQRFGSELNFGANSVLACARKPASKTTAPESERA